MKSQFVTSALLSLLYKGDLLSQSRSLQSPLETTLYGGEGQVTGQKNSSERIKRGKHLLAAKIATKP